MRILAIESSCDETAVAIVEDGCSTLAECIASQASLHSQFGGVVPELASRKHVEAMPWVLEEVLQKAGLSLEEIDAFAVTQGPGLVGALLVGVTAAKALASVTGKPLYAVHHIMGHICANYLEHEAFEPPFVCLVASGGHSHLIYCPQEGLYQILGRTRDDAAGEAFDKVARVLGLSYPGGPAIESLAKEGNPTAFEFPEAKLGKDSYDFSFSGLKTYAMNRLHQAKQKDEALCQADFAASFQHSVVQTLLKQSLRACETLGCKRLALAGGVVANQTLTSTFQQACHKHGLQFFAPSKRLCTDNAEMIGAAAYRMILAGAKPSTSTLNAKPSWRIDEVLESIAMEAKGE